MDECVSENHASCTYNNLFPGVFTEHFTDSEPDWLKEERKNFLEKFDKNGDGKLDKVTVTVRML